MNMPIQRPGDGGGDSGPEAFLRHLRTEVERMEAIRRSIRFALKLNMFTSGAFALICLINFFLTMWLNHHIPGAK